MSTRYLAGPDWTRRAKSPRPRYLNQQTTPPAPPVEYGFFDDFDRPDSDALGNAWLGDIGPFGFGILNHRLRPPSHSARVWHLRNTNSVDVEADNNRHDLTFPGNTYLLLCADGNDGSLEHSVRFGFDSSNDLAASFVTVVSGAVTTSHPVTAAGGPWAGWTGGTTNLRATYDPATGLILVYQNGADTPGVQCAGIAPPLPIAAMPYAGIGSIGSPSPAQADQWWDNFGCRL